MIPDLDVTSIVEIDRRFDVDVRAEAAHDPLQHVFSVLHERIGCGVVWEMCVVFAHEPSSLEPAFYKLRRLCVVAVKCCLAYRYLVFKTKYMDNSQFPQSTRPGIGMKFTHSIPDIIFSYSSPHGMCERLLAASIRAGSFCVLAILSQRPLNYEVRINK